MILMSIPGLGPFFEKPQNLFVGDLGIVNPQLFARFLNKGGELSAGIHGTHDKSLKAAAVGLPVKVGIEKPDRLLNNFGIRDHQAETAAVLNIHVNKVERQQEQGAPIDNHHLAVVTDEIVGGSAHRDSRLQEPHLQSAQLGFATAVGMSDESTNRNAPARSGLQSILEFFPVQAKYQDIDTLLGLLDRRQKGRDAVAGLNQ